MLDIPSIVWERLTARFPEYWVAADRNPDVKFPAVLYSLGGDGQTGNGPTIWRVRLDLIVLIDADDWHVVGDVYDEVKSWAGKRSASGHVTRVTDGALPFKSDETVTSSKTTLQYQLSFDLICRP